MYNINVGSKMFRRIKAGKENKGKVKYRSLKNEKQRKRETVAETKCWD